MHLRLCIAVAFGLAGASALHAQQRPQLPERLDTLTVRYGNTVIGRGIMQWTRVGDAQLQVYVWTSAHDGSSVTDSLFSDPISLRPRREVRVTGDTVHLVTFEDGTAAVRTLVRGKAVGAKAAVVSDAPFSSASIEALAATMPLVAETAEEFATYYAPPSTLGVQRTRIVVEARELIEGRPTWRILAATPGGGSRFWVDESTRSVVRSDTREGDALITFRR